jgi:hypothetical protein
MAVNTPTIVPSLNVVKVSPSVVTLNEAPTNIAFYVGTAAFGPVNAPVAVSDMTSYSKVFGAIQARKFDMGSHVAAAVLQGANDFICIRVTDGTDTAATKAVTTGSGTPKTVFTATAKYSGTAGNNIVIAVGTGSKAATFRVTVTMGTTIEAYDNIAIATFGADFAAAVAARPSNLIVVTSGDPTATALAAGFSVTLVGGTDGAGVVSTDLVGDSSTRTGMWAAQNTQASIGVLCDCDDSTTYTTQIAYGEANNVLMIAVGPAGQAISDAITAKQTAGADDTNIKIMLGDWVYFNDPSNGTRMISPQGFVAGRMQNLTASDSSLNKPIFGVVGSQRVGAPGSGTVGTYSDAELLELGLAGIDVLTNPQPRGAIWGVRLGINASSEAGVQDETYTRMENLLLSTFNSGMGQYVGEKINNGLFLDVTTTLDNALGNLLSEGVLAVQEDGSVPYTVQCDKFNNPQSQTSLGLLTAAVQCRFQGIVRDFVIGVEGGAGVTINAQNAQ